MRPFRVGPNKTVRAWPKADNIILILVVVGLAVPTVLIHGVYVISSMVVAIAQFTLAFFRSPLLNHMHHYTFSLATLVLASTMLEFFLLCD
ncbi:hypothetical protein OROHE_008061 [Orobanche hederae]